MSSSSSSELKLKDDGASGAAPSSADSTAALAAKLGLSDEAPPFWQQQISKFGNVAFNSGVVALLRAWANPPPVEAAPESGAASVPEWYAQEWAQRSRGQQLATRVMRDTLAFAAGCYLMDGVEAAMCEVRGGKKDHYNKVMGGVAAGGLLGFAWYPTDPRGRALVTVAGAAVGYITWLVEAGTNEYMFKMQNELERELLHKSDSELRPELNQWYLRSLIRAKQQQMAQVRRAALEEVSELQRELQRELSAPPGTAAAGAAGGLGPFLGDNGGQAVASIAAEESLGGLPANDIRRRAAAAAAAARAAAAAGGGGAAGNDRGVLVIREDDSDNEAAAESDTAEKLKD